MLYLLSYAGTNLFFCPSSLLTRARTMRTPLPWSGKRGSNPRPSAWKADALPTELFPRDTAKIYSVLFFCLAVLSCLQKVCRWRNWWGGEDSNLRRLRRQIYSLFPLTTREPPQQSSSCLVPSSLSERNLLFSFCGARLSGATSLSVWSWRRDLNPQPPHYK